MYKPFSPSRYCPHQFSPSYGYPLTISKFMSSPCVIYALLPSFPQEDTRKAIFSKGGVTCPKTTRRDAIRCWKKQRVMPQVWKFLSCIPLEFCPVPNIFHGNPISCECDDQYDINTLRHRSNVLFVKYVSTFISNILAPFLLWMFALFLICIIQMNKLPAKSLIHH